MSHEELIQMIHQALSEALVELEHWFEPSEEHRVYHPVTHALLDSALERTGGPAFMLAELLPFQKSFDEPA